MPTNWADVNIANLSQEQLKFLQEIYDHPSETKLLQGVAGSGKTLVAAFALAKLQSNQNIGLLVFTNMHEQYISQNFRDRSVSLAVDHYHSWINKHPIPKKDIFIVDEAQDFKKDWIENVKSNSQSQIWIGDIQQQIYSDARNDHGFIDEVISIKASQKTVFKVNYRNSLKIARFASNFITVTNEELALGVTREIKSDDFITSMLRVNRKRNESPVTLIKAESIEQEYKTIIKLIQQIQNNKKLKSRRIAIAHMLYRNERHINDISVDRISEELTKEGISHYRRDRNSFSLTGLDFNDDNLIVVSTISGLKGLEFDYIFFPHSEYASLFGDPIIRDNLLFVLFTRARQSVYCSYVDEQASYVWDRIKDQKALDYIEKIDAKDILNPPTDNSSSTSLNTINI